MSYVSRWHVRGVDPRVDLEKKSCDLTYKQLTSRSVRLATTLYALGSIDLRMSTK